ncbi:MAG: endonuclease Q family protein [Candidatus Uhrbacteria bacterium]|nr:endonuclease Q family protein [Candidatus Uhrbacteria bacterium]
MRTIVDWHIHSKYSRACSKQLELPMIDAWCARKGIDIVATGDWTHPAWFAHIKDHLEETRQGIFGLKHSNTQRLNHSTEFMLVQEVSQIYKKGDKTRRIHNLIFSPSIETCEKVIAEFGRRGFNLKADGRPILGIDSEDLYKLLKDIDEKIIVIPAHAWTPWYAVFGSKSGFDSLEECFGSMTPYIYAIETGLSSNPMMNWQISSLDSVVMISNSDAHSPRNLGREANVFEFDEPPTFDEFMRVLREQDTNRFKYTIEFYPEEGKYHFDGCATCKFSCDPVESRRLGERCPTCKRPLTLGVHHRVQALADREAGAVSNRKIPFKSIVPLAEIIAQVKGVSSTQSKRVDEEYTRLTDTVADEFTLLLDTPVDVIRTNASDPNLALAIEKMRRGDLKIKPGYDGLYGTVHIFGEQEPPKPTQSTLL